MKLLLENWREYLEEAPKRKSAAGIKKAIKDLTQQGGNTGGNPTGMKAVKRPLGDKDEDEISAPPGAPGGGSIGHGALEEADEESFRIRDSMQTDIWQNEVLNPEVKKRLIEIAENFLNGLEVDIQMEDLRFTGSLANYNWSQYSDVDMHIVVDFSKVNEDVELVKAYFDEARMRWNDKHRIMIHGFEVEIYVEDVDEDHKSSGIYSILDDEWLNKPDPDGDGIDYETAQKKASDFVNRTQSIEKLVSKEKYQIALDRIERTKQKIRDMRQAGLESEEAEFSSENIAFKILRRDDILKQLNDLKRMAYDSQMSLKQENDSDNSFQN